MSNAGANYPRLGISNVLPSDTKVVYSRVPGRGSVGRIADLFAHAAQHEFKLDAIRANHMGILIHAMLDGIFMLAKGASIYTETASGYQESLIATRFSISEMIQDDKFQMGIEVWVKEQWNKSTALADLRQLVRGTDRVEARYNMKLKLLEFRVIRKQTLETAEEKLIELVVIADESDRIYQGSDLPQELSELPFDKWLEDVYKASGKLGTDDGKGSGEIYFQGESMQNETETSRVIANREKIAVEDKVKIEMHQNCWEDGVENLDLKSTIDAENEQRVEQKAEEILAESLDEIKDERAKVIVQDSKRKELRAKHDLIVSQRKAEKYEALLEEKEKAIQKKTSEIRYLNTKLLEKTGSSEFSESAQKFKEKALLMADMLKKVKDDNSALERMVLDLRQKLRIAETSGPSGGKSEGGGGMTVAQQQIEDLLKKIDVYQRALGEEKAKVISVNERLAVAEKEAQAAGPIIEDLEARVEHTLKVAQQHKKETEQVKQKLVQSDAEKNKIKNELVKAQAQIQTLLKRQAS